MSHYDQVGLPGFQFIQDKLDYRSRLHHSNVDAFDHVQRDDLIQASVIMASFLYNAATRDELLPRKPMPTEPTAREKERLQRAKAEARRKNQRELKRKSW